ncbi:bromodomain associated protein [Rhizoctonia solani]|uniref:Bromodomain associated protein n=1 Tax=Rhizoctonia solani TaxID=456999 RepID=A0A8H8NP31_9AGAM|nr:bromodomain associated protein [Rhizoctonia solani]QRW16083.1 bromodomain associated protein [Rhizoctonia solani]
MASRSTRGMASLQDAIEKLSVREKLLLSQAIYEYGSSKWDEVSKLVVAHPLTERPNTFFSPNNCLAMYNHLMRDVGYGPSNPPPGDTTVPKAPVHKQMALHYYKHHLLDLKNLIAAEEARFKTLTVEIEEISAGKWDEKILAEINSVSPSDGFRLPSASPLPKHLTLSSEEFGQRPESPSDSQRPYSPGGRSTRDGTPVDASTPRTNPSSPAADRSKPVSTTSTGSQPRPWNSKDNKRVREMKERRAREQLGKLAPIVSEQPEPTTEDAQPETPIAETPQTPVPPSASIGLTEEPTSVTAPDSSVKPDVSISEDSQPADAEGTPVTAIESVVDMTEDIMESSQPSDDSKGTKIKRRASDVSMADVPPDPKRPRQEDTEMQDMSTDAPTQSPEPSTSHPTPVARGSAAPTPTSTSTSTAPPPSAPAPQPTAVTNKKFQNVISMVHQQIYQHRGGNIFHNPIKKSEAPDYYEIVRRPMDLKTVKSRIKDGVISSADHFKRDVFLMFANAIMYNRPGTSVNDIAAEASHGWPILTRRLITLSF